MRVGNGVRVVALAIGIDVLNLPSEIILNFDDCYYIPALTKSIIYVSYLNKKGFHLTFSIVLNGVLYASGTLYNRIHILDMSNTILISHDNKRQ